MTGQNYRNKFCPEKSKRISGKTNSYCESHWAYWSGGNKRIGGFVVSRAESDKVSILSSSGLTAKFYLPCNNRVLFPVDDLCRNSCENEAEIFLGQVSKE